MELVCRILSEFGKHAKRRSAAGKSSNVCYGTVIMKVGCVTSSALFREVVGDRKMLTGITTEVVLCCHELVVTRLRVGERRHDLGLD